jgi:hypothetical protein
MDFATRIINAIADRVPAFDSRAVLFAMIAGWLAGVAWYMVVGRTRPQWMGNKNDTGMSPRTQFLAALAQVVMTIMLAVVMKRLGETTTWGGVTTAFTIWLGFVITTMIVHHSHLGARFSMTVVDGLHWLIVLAVMGAVIGALEDPKAAALKSSMPGNPPPASEAPAKAGG